MRISKIRVNNYLITSTVRSLRENLKLRSCRIDLAMGLGRAWVEYRRVFASSAQNSYMEASTWQKKGKSSDEKLM